MPRRAFHLAAIYILGALISMALAIPTLIYLLMPPRTRKNTGYVDAGDISQLTPGTPVEMSFQQSRVDGWRVVTEKKTAWVVKELGQQDCRLRTAVHAPRLRLSLGRRREAVRLPVPCLVFSLDGKVLAGPAPRPLDRYVTKIQDNRLQLGALRPSDDKERLTA
jgi:menaquinol-cytochrome c reductase iron-sulfur subunit